MKKYMVKYMAVLFVAKYSYLFLNDEYIFSGSFYL